MNLVKLLGITLFLAVLYVSLLLSDPNAGSWENHIRLAERIGFYGIISLAAGILIISGGIDLSIGSVVGLTATLMAILVTDLKWSWAIALPTIIAVGVAIGLFQGLLVTKVRVQAFIVTLCGLFIFRGLARTIAKDAKKNLEAPFPAIEQFLGGKIFGIPTPFLMFLILALAAAVVMHYSVLGRYLFAIGSNERAAQFAGVSTNKVRITAFVICSTLTAFYGILFVTKYDGAQPSESGSFLELYAIAGAVLGGCSLRGGEGTVFGIMIGTSILAILPNFVNMWGMSSEVEYLVIGVALLLGAIMDEVIRTFAKKS